jgi:hypothetical protein
MGAPRTPKQKAIQAVVISETEGATSLEIGRRLNMPSSTVRDILAGNSPRWAAVRNDAEYHRYAIECKRQLQLGYSEMAKASLEQAEKQLPNASYAQAMVGAAIATDKALRLNAEMPTNNPMEGHTAQSLDELAELLARSLLPKDETSNGE